MSENRNPTEMLMKQTLHTLWPILNHLKEIDSERTKQTVADAIEACDREGCGNDIPRAIAAGVFKGIPLEEIRKSSIANQGE